MSDRKLALIVKFAAQDSLTGVLGRLAGATNLAQGSLKKLRDTAKFEKDELEKLKSAIGAAGVPTHAMINDQKRLESALAQTTKKIDAQRASMARQSRANAAGQNAVHAGQGNLAVGASLAAPLILGVKAAADFQSGMIDIRQKADLSAAATDRLQASIIAGAAASKQLPESFRQGVDVLAGFGLDTKQSAAMMTPIARAATAYRAEISDLAAASFAVTGNLKLPFDQTARALDIMAQAGKSGAFEMKDMAQYFPALTAQAQAFGQTGAPAVADLAAALQIARKGTGDAASSANNIQNLLAKINMEDTQKKFKAFGIDLPKALKKAYAEGKTPLEAIAELSQQATGGDLSKLTLLFGDMQAQGALRPLIQNMAEYRKIRAQALAAKGTVDADFAIRSKSAAIQAQALMGNLQNLAMTLGNTLLPSLVEVSANVLAVSTRFSNWADKNKTLADIIIKTVAAIALANLALGAGRIIYGGVVGPLTAVARAYTFLAASSKVAAVAGFASNLLAGGWTLVTGAAAGFIPAVMGAASAVGAFMIPLLPIIGIIAAVAIAIGLVYLAFKNWDKITAFVSGIWGQIKSTFAKIDWGKMGMDILKGLANALLFGLPGLIGTVGKIAGAVAGTFKNKLGIHSPSRIFMGFGEHINHGLRWGLEHSQRHPIRQAGLIAAGVATAFIGGASPSLASPSLNSPSLSGQTTSPNRSQSAVHIGNITINITAQNGQSPRDIAVAVRDELTKLTAITRRSSYRDDPA